MKVVAPSTTEDAYGLMRAAIDDPDPVLIIENTPNYGTKGPAPVPGYRTPIGKAAVRAEGKDVTIVSYSRTAMEALFALPALTEAGISAEIIDLRSIQPWDEEAVIASVAKTGRLLIVHEAVTPFGAGAEIAAVVQDKLFGKLKAPVKRLGAPFNPVPFSKVLEDAHIPKAARIVEAVKALVRA
jgi:pyruvate dehydrogenase E1 component beta subunit